MRSDAVRNSQRILAAAREVVAERGARVPMEVIAQRAGVAVGTLYRHHATKAELLAAAVRDTMASVADATEEAQSRIASGADAAAELFGLLHLVVELQIRDKALKRALAALRPVPDTGPAEAQQIRAMTALAAVIGAGRAERGLRADLTVADVLLHFDGLPDNADDARRYLDLVLPALRQSSAPTPASPSNGAPTRRSG